MNFKLCKNNEYPVVVGYVELEEALHVAELEVSFLGEILLVQLLEDLDAHFDLGLVVTFVETAAEFDETVHVLLLMVELDGLFDLLGGDEELGGDLPVALLLDPLGLVLEQSGDVALVLLKLGEA